MTLPFIPKHEKPLLWLLACAMFAFLASSPWSQGVSLFKKTGMRRTIQEQWERLFFFFFLILPSSLLRSGRVNYEASLHWDRNYLWWARLAAKMESSRVDIFVLGNLQIFPLSPIYPDKQNVPCFTFKPHFTQTFCRWIGCAHTSLFFFITFLFCLYLLNGIRRTFWFGFSYSNNAGKKRSGNVYSRVEQAKYKSL